MRQSSCPAGKGDKPNNVWSDLKHQRVHAHLPVGQILLWLTSCVSQDLVVYRQMYTCDPESLSALTRPCTFVAWLKPLELWFWSPPAWRHRADWKVVSEWTVITSGHRAYARCATARALRSGQRFLKFWGMCDQICVIEVSKISTQERFEAVTNCPSGANFWNDVWTDWGCRDAQDLKPGKCRGSQIVRE